MDHQNWEPQVIRKSAEAIKRDAMRTGQKVTVERKSDESIRQAKLEQQEFGKPKMLASASRQELVQRRLAEKLTQQQLDQRCSFPPHTIRDLEANKRPPTQKELQTLNRILKCGLRLE